MKKNKLVFLVVFLLVAIGLVFIAKGSTKNEPQTPQEKKKSDIPLEKRPYVSLTPSVDGHTLSLGVLFPEGASSLDYKLIYLADGLQQGVSGTSITPSEGERFASQDLLLGTCSKGVCKYDKNVEEGELSIEMEYEKEYGEFTAHFRYYQPKVESLSSTDGNLIFKPQTPLAGYSIVMETVGLPEKVQGKPLSNPLGIFFSGKKEHEGQLTLLVSNLSSQVVLLARRNEAWETIPVTVTSDVIGATTSASSTFLVVER